MSGQLIQFVGSLAAILALAGLAWWLKLGPEGHISNERQAREAAQEAVDGFAPEHMAIDREGRGALLSDAAGQVLLLRPHGTHFAARVLTPAAKVRLVDQYLEVDTSEKRFGSVKLDIDDAPAWVQRIEAIE